MGGGVVAGNKPKEMFDMLDTIPHGEEALQMIRFASEGRMVEDNTIKNRLPEECLPKVLNESAVRD